MVPAHLHSDRGSRFIASLLDSLFGFACVLPGAIVFAIGMSTETTLTAFLGGVGAAIGLVGALVVQVRLLREGLTVGKRQQGLRIVEYPTLAPVSLGVAFGMRYIVGQMLPAFIPGIGSVYGLADVLFIFSAERRCLHDYIARTIVVDEREWQALHAGAAGEFADADLFTDEGR